MSAGLDTRLIVSSLKELGAKNLIGFSYGLKNNSEAKAAKMLCDYTLIDEKSDHDFGRMFTKSYVRHLFNVKEILGLRIASTLNLSYYFWLMRTIRENINSGTFDSWSKSWLNKMSNLKGM